MDPRPYHFQFRKPRLSNPTFQSNNLYDSIYQLNIAKTQRILQQRNTQVYRPKNTQNKKPMSEPDQMKRHQSMQFPKSQKFEMGRYPSKVQINSMSKQKAMPIQNGRIASKLSNYGYNLMKPQKIGTSENLMRVDQREVFDKQQHMFDIISYQPTQYRARLKMHPRLTLEDKLNERYGLPITQQV